MCVYSFSSRWDHGTRFSTSSFFHHTNPTSFYTWVQAFLFTDLNSNREQWLRNRRFCAQRFQWHRCDQQRPLVNPHIFVCESYRYSVGQFAYVCFFDRYSLFRQSCSNMRPKGTSVSHLSSCVINTAVNSTGVSMTLLYQAWQAELTLTLYFRI
jgi:hypothetical protein